MKNLLFIIALLICNNSFSQSLEDSFLKFDEVMNQYNLEYTSATTSQEQEIINVKFEAIIKKAEIELEQSIQRFANLDIEAAEKEERKQIELLKEESSIDSLTEVIVSSSVELEAEISEIELLSSRAKNYNYIYNRYNLDTSNKTGYTMREVGLFKAINVILPNSDITKKELSILIFDKIQSMKQ